MKARAAVNPARVADRLRRRVLGAPAATDNVAYNRDLWDRYADAWQADPKFRIRAADVPDEAHQVRTLGEEWGTIGDMEAVLADWLLPQLTPESVVAEVGVGGGRIADRVAPQVRELNCFDISARMLDAARGRLSGRPNVKLHLLEVSGLPDGLDDRYDFAYAFDVFVHVDLHCQWRYLKDFARVLKPGGRALAHTANLTAPGGWERFSSQQRYLPEGFYFVTPDQVKWLAAKAGLTVVRESKPDNGNFYLERDYLILLEKA